MSMMMSRNSKGTTRWQAVQTPSPSKSRKAEPPHWKAFKVFDRNKDGYISATEIMSTMAELGIYLTNEDVKCMFAAADTNNDGRIDYKEFSAMLSENPVLRGKAVELQEKREKSMYEKLFGKAFTENGKHKQTSYFFFYITRTF